MTIDQYIQWTDSTAVYPKEREQEYLRLGLLSEVGEVAGVLKRRVRDGETSQSKLLAEMGDLLWYLARLYRDAGTWKEAQRVEANDITNLHGSDQHAQSDTTTLVEMAALSDGSIGTVTRYLRLLRRHNFTLDEIIQSNTEKLEGRKQRNTIHGAGDER